MFRKSNDTWNIVVQCWRGCGCRWKPFSVSVFISCLTQEVLCKCTSECIHEPQTAKVEFNHHHHLLWCSDGDMSRCPRLPVGSSFFAFQSSSLTWLDCNENKTVKKTWTNALTFGIQQSQQSAPFLITQWSLARVPSRLYCRNMFAL